MRPFPLLRPSDTSVCTCLSCLTQLRESDLVAQLRVGQQLRGALAEAERAHGPALQAALGRLDPVLQGQVSGWVAICRQHTSQFLQRATITCVRCRAMYVCGVRQSLCHSASMAVWGAAHPAVCTVCNLWLQVRSACGLPPVS
jgi:hypothetical protein